MFRGTASYYTQYRPGYPPELLAGLVAAAGVGRTSRVLDLGCGPGTIAIPLAELVDSVTAVDREPEMLDELRRRAPANVTAVEAFAEDIDESWGTFDLVTIGRALHWFDSPLVLSRLDAVTPAVALLGASLDQSDAMKDVLAVAQEVLGERPPMRGAGVRYETALAASTFSDVRELTAVDERVWTVDDLIGFAYSTSFASLERVGSRRPAFEQALRACLRPRYSERVVISAWLGTRPS